MKNLKYISILFISIFMASCEDVVDVDLNTAAPRLVIDASIDWIKGTDGSIQTIRLTKTAGFYDTEVPAVSGATVFVNNSALSTFEFIETPGTGEYVCANFIPVIGETYQLTVVVEGEIYVANETLIGAPDIDSVNQTSDGGIDGDLTEIKFFFQDNGETDNFYMSAFETEDIVFPEYFVFDDEFTQGSENFGLYMSDDINAGDELTLSLYGISERFMSYMDIVLDLAYGGGGPWATPPTNVRGNIVNQTDADHFALGYFRLSEVDRMVYIVE